ncbi:MAG: hypothetical protein EBR34_16030, partial [Sphingomonadaceae bacterium]|nr:hypothetical protein [Sphingomonadaceae bacterium]
MALKHVGYARELIDEIREDLDDYFVGRKDFIKNMHTAYRLIMCNMVVCTFSRTCLSLPSTEKLYNRGSYFNNLFLTRAATEEVLTGLAKKGYIKKNKGNKQLKKVNNYQPTKKLQLLVLPLLYKVAEEYSNTTDLIIFKQAKDKNKQQQPNKTTRTQDTKQQVGTMRRSSLQLETTYGTDFKALTRINKALKKFTYALKSPVKRIYSDENPMLGGRLYTRLQGLPDRRARIRINTLFNGEPVAEVDLSANHPRMLMALSRKELSATFYDDVAQST